MSILREIYNEGIERYFEILEAEQRATDKDKIKKLRSQRAHYAKRNRDLDNFITNLKP